MKKPISKILLYTLFLSIQIGCSLKTEQKKENPNLLFILTDEQRFDTSAPYGNENIITPNLNNLGKAGIVFKNAYVTQPVCSPARSTILTGLYPHTTGVTSNNVPLDEKMKTLPELIGDSSYTSAFIGKWHLGRENDAWHGFDERVSTEGWYTDDDTTNMTDYNKWLRKQGYEPDNANQTFSRTFVSNLPYKYSKSKFMEMKGIEFLEKSKDQPFIMYLSFLEPHQPNNGPFNDLHDTTLVELDSTYDMKTSCELPLRYHMKKGYTYGDISTKELFVRYWGLVHQVDLSVGAMLRKLDSLRLSENTIVVFTSEHGKMMRKFGLTGKTVMYEQSSRIPWMMRIPGVDSKVINQKVSQIDLLPTLLDLMHQEVPDQLQGKSLVPLINDEIHTNGPVFIEMNPFSNWQDQLKRCPEWASLDDCKQAVQTRIRTIVTQDGWKLNWSSSDKSQLFNLNNDPMEINNLYYKQQYQGKIKALESLITQWQQETGDTVNLTPL